MNLVELTEAIIKRLVTDPETVSVKEFDTEEEKYSKENFQVCSIPFLP